MDSFNFKPNMDQLKQIVGINCDIIADDKYPYNFLVYIPKENIDFNISLEFDNKFNEKNTYEGNLNLFDFTNILALRKAGDFNEYDQIYKILKGGNVKLLKISNVNDFNIDGNGNQANFSAELLPKQSIIFHFKLINKKYLKCLTTIASEIDFIDLKPFWPSINLNINNEEIKLSFGLYSDLLIDLFGK